MSDSQAPSVPDIKLNDGHTIPVIGFGTGPSFKPSPLDNADIQEPQTTVKTVQNMSYLPSKLDIGT